jgi:hypothetical protein
VSSRLLDVFLGRALALFLIAPELLLPWLGNSYGGAAREMIASTSSRLGRLAPPAASAAEAAPSPDQEVLKAISFDITGVRQHLDEIATQLTVDHE